MILALLVGCLPVGDQFRPQITDVEGIQHLGDVDVQTFNSLLDPAAVTYGRLGAPEQQGTFGGATFNFVGTGGEMCVVVDPEAVFWNVSVDRDIDQGQRFKYADRFEDDGDLDLSVGLAAYYNGSPGVELGNFAAVYTDPLGEAHELEFNECTQTGYQGTPDVHSGRGTAEFCTIDTDNRAGITFTGVLDTFALPHDDSILNFGLAVLDGPCASITECTIPNEVGLAEGVDAIEGKEWFAEIEDAVCQGVGAVNRVCEEGMDAYPDSPPCEEYTFTGG